MTQQEKVVEHMLKHRDQEWFYPPDFMQGGDLFVGYEASARLSELATDFPLMVESRRRGKYMERRIRWEEFPQWWPLLPESLQLIFVRRGFSAEPIFEV